MEIIDDKVILRDFIESDVDDWIRWNTVDTEWQLWDAPWEYDEGGNAFDPVQYRAEVLQWLAEEKDDNRVRSSFQVCVNDSARTHIGVCNSYKIDGDFDYTAGDGLRTIGINIPPLSARRRGYATAAWRLFINYLMIHGAAEIYTQTWSGNERVIGLIQKLGFEERGRRRGARRVRGRAYDALTFRLNMQLFSCHTPPATHGATPARN